MLPFQHQLLQTPQMLQRLLLSSLLCFAFACSDSPNTKSSARSLPKPIMASVSAQQLLSQELLLQHAPITAYKSQCAQCHGTDGSLFQQPPLNIGPEYTRVMREMMETTTLDPPTNEVDLAYMAAYVRSLKAKKPFISVTQIHPNAAENTVELMLEGTKGLSVQILAQGEEVAYNRADEGNFERFTVEWNSAENNHQPNLEITAEGAPAAGKATIAYPENLWAQ